MKKLLYFLYQWFVYVPFLVILTILVAGSGILFTLAFQPKRGFLYSVIVWGKLLCYATLSGVTVKGRENINPRESYVFVSNHQGAFDVFLIYGFLHSNFRWIMKKELRQIPLVGKLCEMIGHIFIDRTSMHSIMESLERAKKSLSNGVSVVVFPEGSRTHTGKVGSFKRGAYQLAIDLQIPIVPLTIDGAFEVLNRDSNVMSPGHFNLTIHPPISTEGLTQADINRLINETRTTIISALPDKYKE